MLRPSYVRMQVCQPFTEAKFNFKKAYMKEVLFQFEPRSACAHHINDHGISKSKDDEASFEPVLLDSASASSSPNLVRGMQVSQYLLLHVL